MIFRKFSYVQYVCGHFSALWVIWLFLKNYLPCKKYRSSTSKRTYFSKPCYRELYNINAIKIKFKYDSEEHKQTSGCQTSILWMLTLRSALRARCSMLCCIALSCSIMQSTISEWWGNRSGANFSFNHAYMTHFNHAYSTHIIAFHCVKSAVNLHALSTALV